MLVAAGVFWGEALGTGVALGSGRVGEALGPAGVSGTSVGAAPCFEGEAPCFEGVAVGVGCAAGVRVGRLSWRAVGVGAAGGTALHAVRSTAMRRVKNRRMSSNPAWLGG